ncbi:hypothetical protein EDD22DRAFT_349704 [Suillus occidentalis]|nr:hypothetical protein EDD22DRAFT_349704 [Suillus occidentalis]
MILFILLLVGTHGRLLAHVPAKCLLIFPVLHLLSDTDHLLGMTVIDANGRCTQRYDGVTPTDVWMDHHSSGLVQSLSFPLLQTIPKYSRAHVPGPAGNNMKRCIIFRSVGLGSVSMTNDDVRISSCVFL